MCVQITSNPLTPSLSPSDGERVPEGRVRGDSWHLEGKSVLAEEAAIERDSASTRNV